MTIGEIDKALEGLSQSDVQTHLLAVGPIYTKKHNIFKVTLSPVFWKMLHLSILHHLGTSAA
jgi:hypothetical protein